MVGRSGRRQSLLDLPPTVELISLAEPESGRSKAGERCAKRCLPGFFLPQAESASTGDCVNWEHRRSMITGLNSNHLTRFSIPCGQRGESSALMMKVIGSLNRDKLAGIQADALPTRSDWTRMPTGFKPTSREGKCRCRETQAAPDCPRDASEHRASIFSSTRQRPITPTTCAPAAREIRENHAGLYFLLQLSAGRNARSSMLRLG